MIFPKMEDYPKSKPGYHSIRKGDILIRWNMPKAHVHVYEVVYKERHVAKVDLKLIKCFHNKAVLDKLFQEQLGKPWEPCVLNEQKSVPWMMLSMNLETRDDSRWLQTDAEKVLFGVRVCP